MGGEIRFITSLVMIGLFSIAILGFAINFASDNSASISIADDSEMSSVFTKVKTNTSSFKGGAEDTYESIVKSTIEPGSDTIQSTGPFAITPSNMIGVVSNILGTAYKKIFGSGSQFAIFITTFLGILVFLAAFYLYKTLRGLPD